MLNCYQIHPEIISSINRGELIGFFSSLRTIRSINDPAKIRVSVYSTTCNNAQHSGIVTSKVSHLEMMWKSVKHN
jgi:hypothetical protein